MIHCSSCHFPYLKMDYLWGLDKSNGICYNRLMERKVIKKGDPIIIPGAEFMSKEELSKAKQNESMRRQMARRRGGEPQEKHTKQELRKLNTDEMIEMAKDSRNLALQTLSKKLTQVYSDNDQLRKVNLATLATVFGIMFDKGQLMDGLSTQNIAIQAKIDVNMTSDKALEVLNKMRENFTKEE